ncbi:MAG: hypothetical protein PHC75_05540 [Burkholderiales bacterium]|nr:hypothetical protein [Burkholderiales bacterium]
MKYNNFSGNLNATVGVFFDSFAKIAISIAVMTGAIHLAPEIVHHQVIPGVCFGLFMLNLAYYLQAKYMTRKTGQSITALPSGLQSSCVFVWLFAVMLPISSRTGNPLLAYHVVLVANFLNAIFFTIVSIILITCKKYIPKTALFSGLAGSAFTWLAVNNLPLLVAHPLSGLLPLFVMLILMFAKYDKNVPLIMLGVIFGTIIALLTNEFTVNNNLINQSIYLHLPQFAGLPLDSNVINYCLQFLPLIIAFAVIDAISAVQTLEEARLSDDKFNPYTSLFISGGISGLSAFFGNPFAMALFFGHSSWKRANATANYSLFNGLIYLLLAFSGVAQLLVAVIPDWVALPVLIIIGLMTTAVSFQALEKDEHILLVIGIIPILIELIYNKLELLAFQHNIEILNDPTIHGMFILSKGAILFSMLITSMLYYVMKRNWGSAFICVIFLLVCSTLGLIHSQSPQLIFFSTMNYFYISLAFILLFIALVTKNARIKI